MLCLNTHSDPYQPYTHARTHARTTTQARTHARTHARMSTAHLHPTPHTGAPAGRKQLKDDGVHVADWLIALATFTGMAARRVPGIEISALCHYVACRLRCVSSDSAEPQCDWLLLKELVAQMTVRGARCCCCCCCCAECVQAVCSCVRAVPPGQLVVQVVVRGLAGGLVRASLAVCGTCAALAAALLWCLAPLTAECAVQWPCSAA